MINQSMSKVFIHLCLLILILFGVYIRTHGTSDYHYSEDESLHVGISQAASLPDTLRQSLYEAHPPMLYVLMHYWIKISDNRQFVRALSLVFGIALIPLFYHIGKKLNGELTGLCCATLVTFSYGAIIQAYVVRHYSILLFLLSCSLYCYLLWRNEKKKAQLYAYLFFATLACLTHFSAIFAIFSIAAYECIKGWKSKHSIAGWCLANAFIGFVAVCTYVFWINRGTVFSGNYFYVSSWLSLIVVALLNPLRAAGYILPSMILVPAIIFPLFLPSCRNDKNLQQFILLTCSAFAIGMFLVVINHYYPAGTRHGIWVLPFVIISCGWVLSHGMSDVSDWIRQKTSFSALPFCMLGLIILCFYMYEPQKRFAERSEYQMKEKNWQDMQHYLQSLDDSSVIVAARDDAIMLYDLYPYLGQDAFSGKVMATRVPYLHTHIIFNPYHRRLTNKEILLATLNEAEQKQMLANVKHLVFMKTVWDVFGEPKAPMPYLFTCKQIEKNIISFPAFSYPPVQDVPISDEEINVEPTGYMSVNKKEFFEKLIVSPSKASECWGDAYHAG